MAVLGSAVIFVTMALIHRQMRLRVMVVLTQKSKLAATGSKMVLLVASGAAVRIDE